MEALAKAAEDFDTDALDAVAADALRHSPTWSKNRVICSEQLKQLWMCGMRWLPFPRMPLPDPKEPGFEAFIDHIFNNAHNAAPAIATVSALPAPASDPLAIAATAKPDPPTLAEAHAGGMESEGESIASSPSWVVETLTDDEASGGAGCSLQVWSYRTHHTSIRPTPI